MPKGTHKEGYHGERAPIDKGTPIRGRTNQNRREGLVRFGDKLQTYSTFK
jgi:hypothetical protein